MTKQELMETYTAEQLAEMAEKRTPFTDKELIQKWKELAEEFHNGYCKALEENERLQSEVEKYRKAFENTKNERDCQIAEYQNRVDKDKTELERVGNIINQIDDILEKLFGVRHDSVDKPDEFEKILSEKVKGSVTDFLPTEPIKVADMLINASRKRTNCMTSKEYNKYIFEEWQLRQIAEHLLVYCNHNGEAEE